MSGETTTVVPPRSDGRRLVAERLAAAGRHDDERVAAVEDGQHRLLLQRAERVVSPMMGDEVAEAIEHRGDGTSGGEWGVGCGESA